MKTPKTQPRSIEQRGVSLQELMIMLSVVCILASGTAQFVSRLKKNQLSLRALAGRDALHERLTSFVQFPPNLAASLTRNPAFVACLVGSHGGHTDCRSGNEAEPQPFFLVVPSSKNGAHPRAHLAGPESLPTHYDIEGQPCEGTSATCLFSASITFKAACSEGKKICDRAVHFDFFIAVRTERANGSEDWPTLAPSVATVRMHAAQIEAAALESAVFPPGSRAPGVDSGRGGVGGAESASSNVTFGTGEGGAAGRPSLRRPSRGLPPYSSSDGGRTTPAPRVPSRGRVPRQLRNEPEGVQAEAKEAHEARP